ncbi:MAG: hypothetical protein OCC46_13870 [Pseudodesulfovibrio sp.]
MVLELSLAQQASQFVGSLNVQSAPSVEKSVDDQGQDAKIPEQSGDVVSISEEARALIAAEDSGESGETAEDQEQDQLVQQLTEQIEELQTEIKELEEGDLPEKDKISQISDKQVQLMELQDQLLKAQQADLEMEGMASGGGTRANGAGNDVASF